MSRLDELIEKLCPDGVEYKELGEVARYAKTRIAASKMNENNYVGVENLLQEKRGKTTASSVPAFGTVIAFERGDILIGNIRPYLKKIWLADCEGGTNGDVLTVQIKDRSLFIPEYLYYILSSDKFFLYDTQNSKGAKMPRGSKEAVMKYKLPIPPLPVQQEIVRILDNFTKLEKKLEKELEKELELRRKQYEYYRNLLLDFKDVHTGGTNAYSIPWLAEMLHELCPDGVEYRALGEIFNTKNGYTPSKANKDYWTNGTVPWFRMEDIRKNGTILNSAIQNVSVSAIKKSVFPANSIIIATTATIGQHALIKVPSLANQQFTYLMVKENFKERFDVKFLYYYCFKLDEYCKECLNQGNFAAVDMKKFAKFEFPIPPLAVQQEIVRILDSFTKLEKELEQELEKELAARQKQYEYYRDLLLDFKNEKENIR